MATYYHSSGRPSGGSGGDWWSWLPIIILFCIPSPFTCVVAFFLLVSKLKGGGKKKTVKRHPYDVQRDAQTWEQVTWDEGKTASSGERAQTGGAKTSGTYSAKAAGSSAQKQKAAPKGPKRGTGGLLILVGAAVAAVFGLGFVTVLADAIMYGPWLYDLSGLLACLMFMVGGFVTLGVGVGKKRRAERYLSYLGYIGANREVPLANMAAAFGVSVRKLCKDLREMLAKGVLPAGYLDLAEGKLYLTEMGYRAPRKEEKKPAEAAVQPEQTEDQILREIRQVNDDIPDEEMSEKIDRIEEITRKILAYQKQHPEKDSQLRSFLNYYLPTTLKILRAYAQLDAQGIEGENISAAKGRIEGMMDQVVAGFEKQLDKLFRDDALDIATDVKVLEDMLRKDGLSDDGSMTMTMM